MREIKFRAWVPPMKNGQTNKMIDGVQPSFAHESPTVMSPVAGMTIYEPMGEKRYWYEIPVLAIMECTGFKDKNGKDIYEGDILNVCNGSINGINWMNDPYVVGWGKCGWDLPAFCWNKDKSDAMDSTHWCEVIGNIYENPELCKPQ